MISTAMVRPVLPSPYHKIVPTSQLAQTEITSRELRKVSNGTNMQRDHQLCLEVSTQNGYDR